MAVVASAGFVAALWLYPPQGISKPTVQLLTNTVVSNTDGTFTTTKTILVESVFTPPLLIVECFSKDIVRWNVESIHRRDATMLKDVDTTETKSGAFANPYGMYRIDVVTKQQTPVRCQYGLSNNAKERIQPEGR